ncbi:MAG TPA: hypothetical protein VN663_22700 [Ramlibacter sp.]|nr:hypothetical protein [Ramlibacter sp.]
MTLSIAEMAKIAELHGRLTIRLTQLDDARRRLALMVKSAKVAPIVTVIYTHGSENRNESYFTERGEFPAAVIIQQQIYKCARLEREVIALGGTVPMDKWRANP